MLVTVKLFAEMRSIYKNKEIIFDFGEDKVTVKAIIDRLLEMDKTGERGAKQILLDSVNHSRVIEAKSINPAMLIMINDVDFKLLGDIDAEVADGDAITFLPTIHGG